MKIIKNINNTLAAVEPAAKLALQIVKSVMMGIVFSILLHEPVAAQQTDLSFAAAKALSAVVQVQCFMSDAFYEKHASIATQMGIKSLGSGGSTLIGSASGVLVSSDGEILTNAHVLNGSDSLMVILPDHRAYKAILVGIDEDADLALLKISENGLDFLELGDPDLVKIGEPVIAAGNPLDLTSTVTAGILSARYRALDDSMNPFLINSYLQSDAASNEGMSGSALIDRSGKLIGINSAIISPSGAFVGYAFTITAGIVKKALHDLREYGRVKHASLDISFSDMHNVQSKKLGNKFFFRRINQQRTKRWCR
jgi:serine protease Do